MLVPVSFQLRTGVVIDMRTAYRERETRQASRLRTLEDINR